MRDYFIRKPMPADCLMGDAASETFYHLVAGERGTRNYQYSRGNEYGYFFEPLINRWIAFDNRMMSMWVEVCRSDREAEEFLTDDGEVFAA